MVPQPHIPFSTAHCLEQSGGQGHARAVPEAQAWEVNLTLCPPGHPHQWVTPFLVKDDQIESSRHKFAASALIPNLCTPLRSLFFCGSYGALGVKIGAMGGRKSKKKRNVRVELRAPFPAHPQSLTLSACTFLEWGRISCKDLGVGSFAAELCTQERQMSGNILAHCFPHTHPHSTPFKLTQLCLFWLERMQELQRICSSCVGAHVWS